MGFIDTILSWLYTAVSGILVAWHWVFDNLGFDPDSGWTWALAIVGLTVTIRALLVPLFVRQIKSTRNMQVLQPQLRELQKKYGHDRERFAQEQMKLYRETGTNPLAACFPLLLQMPILFALFRVIDRAAMGTNLGVLTDEQVNVIRDNALFGDITIASRFTDGGGVRLVIVFLVLVMTATTYLTQRQLMSKNMPESAMSGPYAQQQKILLYVLPVVFAISGLFFPLGAIIYWTTSNFWTMGQQFYVIRNNPAPGTPAFKEKQDRDRARGKTPEEEPTLPARPTQVRQQPKKTTRRERQTRPTQASGSPETAKSAGPSSDSSGVQKSEKSTESPSQQGDSATRNQPKRRTRRDRRGK